MIKLFAQARIPKHEVRSLGASLCQDGKDEGILFLNNGHPKVAITWKTASDKQHKLYQLEEPKREKRKWITAKETAKELNKIFKHKPSSF